MNVEKTKSTDMESNERFDAYIVGKKKNRVFVVDRGRCKGCSICTTICPYDAIWMGDGKSLRGYIFPIENGKCVACKQCVFICPDFALSVHDIAEVTK